MEHARNKSDWRPRMSKSSEVHHMRGRSGSGGGLLKRSCMRIYTESRLASSVRFFILFIIIEYLKEKEGDAVQERVVWVRERVKAWSWDDELPVSSYQYE